MSPRVSLVQAARRGAPPAHCRLSLVSAARRRRPWPLEFSRTFLVRALNPRDVSLSGRVFAGHCFLLLEVRAELDDGAHGARMAPRGGRDGPCQAGQGSRHSRHGGTKTAPLRVARTVSSCPPLPLLLTSSRRPVYAAATRLDRARDGDRCPKKLLQEALDPSSDPWHASLPTGRVVFGTSAAALRRLPSGQISQSHAPRKACEQLFASAVVPKVSYLHNSQFLASRVANRLSKKAANPGEHLAKTTWPVSA